MTGCDLHSAKSTLRPRCRSVYAAVIPQLSASGVVRPSSGQTKAGVQQYQSRCAAGCELAQIVPTSLFADPVQFDLVDFR